MYLGSLLAILSEYKEAIPNAKGNELEVVAGVDGLGDTVGCKLTHVALEKMDDGVTRLRVYVKLPDEVHAKFNPPDLGGRLFSKDQRNKRRRQLIESTQRLGIAWDLACKSVNEIPYSLRPFYDYICVGLIHLHSLLHGETKPK